MIPLFLTNLAAGIVGKRFANAAVIVTGIVLAVGLFFGAKALYDRSVVAHHEQKIQNRVAPANQKADTRRATDVITNARNEEEAHNAIAAQPDQPISPTSRAHACVQLRRAGRSCPAGDGHTGGH